MYTLTLCRSGFTPDDELFADEGLPAARLRLDFTEFNARTGHDMHSPCHAVVYERRINDRPRAQGDPLRPMQGPLDGLVCRRCGGTGSTVEIVGAATRTDAEEMLVAGGTLTVGFRLSTIDRRGPGPLPAHTVLEGRCPMADPGTLDFDAEIDVPSGRLAIVDFIPRAADEALGDDAHRINSDLGQLRYSLAIHAQYGVARLPNYRATFPWTTVEDPDGHDTIVLGTAWPEEWDDGPEDAEARAAIGLRTCIADRLEPAGSRIAGDVWATIAGDISRFEDMPGFADDGYAARLVVRPVHPGRWRAAGRVTGPDEMGTARILTLTRIGDTADE